MIAGILLHPAYAALILLCIVVAAHIVPWFIDKHRHKDIPGPSLAKFSDIWLGKVAASGRRSLVIHEQHARHGIFVRIAPNHISIADPAALGPIYGHGSKALKSDFYDASISFHETIFNTRAEHSRKRKIVANIFSQKSILEFEPHVHAVLKGLVEQLDAMITNGMVEGSEKNGSTKVGQVWFDFVPWAGFLAFDIISDLAFGKAFGMIAAAEDVAEVEVQGRKKRIPAIQILNDRGNFTSSIGVLPLWVRPIIRRLPWYAQGRKAMDNVAGIAVAAVTRRFAEESGRVDLFSKLQKGKDHFGNPMGRNELTAEVLTQLVAGSDTTANSLVAIVYYLAGNSGVQAKLQAELDSIIPRDETVLSFDEIKHLEYLDACISEALRLHGTVATGLPRVVPEGGLDVCGHFFPEGSILSVPTYTIHRDVKVWGADVDVYRPERWFERDQAELNKTFNAFSVGPRACVGKNLAALNLRVATATIFLRYNIVLERPLEKLEVHEGFARKPVSCWIGIQRRQL